MTTAKLHVEGRFLLDPSGRKILLHGFMQPAASWFNGEGHNYADPSDFTSASSVAPLTAYLRSVADIMSNPNSQFGKPHGWQCSFVRFIGDDGGVSNFAPGWDVNGNLNRADQFNGWIANVLAPYVTYCRSVGLYVVICGNPSVSYPGSNTSKNMTQQYRDNLIAFWTAVASHPSIKSADNVMFEICNEPIQIETSFGANDWGSGSDRYWAALTKFMQPIVDAIRATGADNVVWIPGLGWQGEYQGFPAHPVTGTNIGYAAHLYPAYGSAHDNVTAVNKLWTQNYQPTADQFPVIITELMWQPNDGTGYQDLWNASTDGFGLAIKSCMDREGNVSYLLGMTGDVLGNLTQGLSKATFPTEQGAQAGFSWWTTYADTDPQPIVPVTSPNAFLTNLSTRSNVASDAHMQIAGFVIRGSTSKKVLIRANGPALTPLGVPGVVADPTVTVLDAAGTPLATNDDWDFALQPTFGVAGAFDWTRGSHDSALVLDLPPGAYTAQVSGKNAGTGVGLVEIYDVAGDDSTSKIINLSTRSDVLTDAKVQIAGFVIKGNCPKKVLIRASGPALAKLGVPDTLSDPVLTLMDSLGFPLAKNDDWDAATISPIASVCGVFDWAVGSKDAAVVATLPPGAYTATVAGKGSDTGVALVEVYEVP